MHTATCPKCARPIPRSAPKALCSACLVASVFDLADDVSEMPSPAAASERVGGYELLEQIGRGGMGVVFRARDLRLNRLVALKLILTGKLASEIEVKRFRTEAEAAANLDHPNIVPIYEVGESDGRHFFAMKLMDGGSLDPQPADKRQIAGLIAKLARAVHHAHERGILHRDLKPANILLDARGEPAISDFGLARRLQGDSEMTLSGTLVGSPNYMAPEQATGREVTTAADVYSLGAIFYELLTGRPPFVADNVPALLRKIVEEEPSPLVGVQASACLERPDTLKREFQRVDRDLETICLKCLAKEPARRYAGASALADDLERWQRGETILARPVAPAERLWKWARRRPTAAALALVSSAALIGGVILQLANDATLRRQRDHARAQERLTRQNLYAADMFLAHQAIEGGNLALARRTLEGHLPAPGQEDLRGFEWRYLWQQCRGEQVRTLTGFSDAVTCLAYSPDGRWLAAGGGNLVHCWNATNYESIATFEHEPNVMIRSLCFSSDGKTLWTGDSNGKVRRWEGERPREPVQFITWGTGLIHVAVSPDRIVTGERDRPDGKSQGAVTISKFGDDTGQVLTNSGGLAVFSGDGQSFLTGGGNGPLTIWDVATSQSRELLYVTEASAIALSRDGRTAAACPYNSFGLVLIDIATGINRWLHREGLGSLGTPALSDDGQILALACADHTMRLWDVQTLKETRRLVGHLAEVLAVAFAPDGQTLASCGKDQTVRLWSLNPTRGLQQLTQVFYPYAFSPDSRTLTAANDDKDGRIFQQLDVATGQSIPGSETTTPPICQSKFELPPALPVRPGFVRAVALAPDRQSFATGNDDSTIQLWNIAGTTLLATLSGHHDPVSYLAFSPDGRSLVSSASQTVKLWHVPTRREVATLTRQGPTLQPLFSPDGTTLVTYHWTGEARLWRAPSLAEIDRAIGQENPR